ncbi:hypothetical protein JYB87_03765 [Shewanella avicenniae]|uniref:CBS domain-containing protein n=1 Tax=Shewanella avicenniae TaxID=2814294 RepID=A0ABX7QSD3_9GAMM|nr:CBS domain-containing protein [Shewanella avicenniae]QSX34379.1 hypothetical protein JYB87_03765 [Shewanella avicenniae]
MKTLNTFCLSSAQTLAQSSCVTQLNSDSPAVDAMMPFDHQLRMALPATMPAPEAYRQMVDENSKINYVINERHEILGIISRGWLSATHLAKFVDKTHGPSSWTVSDMMLPRYELLAVAQDELENATVADVLASFRSVQRDFLLVINQRGNVCGLFAAEDILQRMQHRPSEQNELNVLNILQQIRQSHKLEAQVVHS